jgi:hypothetical protein
MMRKRNDARAHNPDFSARNGKNNFPRHPVKTQFSSRHY